MKITPYQQQSIPQQPRKFVPLSMLHVPRTSTSYDEYVKDVERKIWQGDYEFTRKIMGGKLVQGYQLKTQS
ncbi:MAG: hypothetical protein HYW24_04805 [Candidatus Aenigmarchaeota archaeon]|nr:hypothetical protein [Candidatus Aenigmarchaeota archaeon]